MESWTLQGRRDVTVIVPVAGAGQAAFSALAVFERVCSRGDDGAICVDSHGVLVALSQRACYASMASSQNALGAGHGSKAAYTAHFIPLKRFPTSQLGTVSHW